MNPRNTRFSWKLFSFDWNNPSAGEHGLISRVTDINGNVQATPEEMPEQISYWEDFSQFKRTVLI
ncbi:MAG: hypothetical protein ACI85S_002423 [Pseudohongiellaceae bacterium]|jgi:hypothetical protein